MRKKNTSNCDSLLEGDDQNDQLNSDTSKQIFEPLVEHLSEDKSSKNSRGAHRHNDHDNVRFASEQKNYRSRAHSKPKLGLKDELSNERFIKEKSDEMSKNSHKAELNFDHHGAVSKKDYVHRKHINDQLGLEMPQPTNWATSEGGSRHPGKPLASRLTFPDGAISPPLLHEGGKAEIAKIAPNSISKNQNIIDKNCQSYVFDIKTGPVPSPPSLPETLPPLAKAHSPNTDQQRPPAIPYVASFKQPAQIPNFAKEKGKTPDKRSPFGQKLADLKKVPSLVLDGLHTKEKLRRAMEKRPCTMECIESTNKTENEAHSNVFDTHPDNPEQQVNHLLNLNADIFDKTFVHSWQPYQKPPPSKPLELFGNKARSSIKILQSRMSHLDSVRKVEFLDDGKDGVFLASVADDCLVKLWNFKYKEALIESQQQGLSMLKQSFPRSGIVPKITGQKAQQMPNHEIPHIQSMKSQVRAPNAQLEKCLENRKHSSASFDFAQAIRTHPAPIFSCCKSYSENLPYKSSQGPVQFFSGDSKGNINCFRLAEGRLLLWKSFKGSSEPIWSLSYAHPGFLLASSPNKIKLFDLSKIKSRGEEFSISTNQRFFAHLEFLNNESFVVNSYSSKTLKNEFLMFDLMKEKEHSRVASRQGPSNAFKSIVATDMLISANEDHSVSLYDIREREQMQAFVAHANAVVSLDVSASRHILVTAGCDSSIRLWDLRTLRCFSELSVHRMKYDDSIFDVKFDPTSDFICTAGADSSVKIFQF